MAACLLRNTVLRSAFIRSLQKAETLSCYSTATEASVDEFKFKYLDDGNASFQKLLFISFLDSAKDHRHLGSVEKNKAPPQPSSPINFFILAFFHLKYDILYA